MTDILLHTGTDPEEKKKIEIEQEAWRTVNAMFEDKERELLSVINEKDKIIEELKRRLGEQ